MLQRAAAYFRAFPHEDFMQMRVLMQQNAKNCNTLNALQHTATHCSALQRTAMNCNALHHAAIHFNTPQFTATARRAPRCSTLQHKAFSLLNMGWLRLVGSLQL